MENSPAMEQEGELSEGNRVGPCPGGTGPGGNVGLPCAKAKGKPGTTTKNVKKEVTSPPQAVRSGIVLINKL